MVRCLVSSTYEAQRRQDLGQPPDLGSHIEMTSPHAFRIAPASSAPSHHQPMFWDRILD